MYNIYIINIFYIKNIWVTLYLYTMYMIYYVCIEMGPGSFPKFPIGNFPEISERKFRYLCGIIPFFYYYISVYWKCVS